MDLKNGLNQQPIENVLNASQPQTSDTVYYHPSTSADEQNETELQETSHDISDNTDANVSSRSNFSLTQLIEDVKGNDLTTFNKLSEKDRHSVIKEALAKYSENLLLIALTFGVIDIAWNVLEMAKDEMSESDYKRFVVAKDGDGSNWPLLAAKGLWGRNKKEYLDLLKRFGRDSNLYTVKNELGETALMLLLKRESDIVTTNIGRSHLITKFKELCNSDRSLNVDQQCTLGHSVSSLDRISPSIVRNTVSNTDWRFEWIREIANDSQWLNMKEVVDALPPHENMQPLLELLLDADGNKTTAFQRILKESAIEALESLLNKIHCVTCLKQTLMKSYWRRRFHELEMPLLAIKAFDTKELCTESYLIPKPSADPAMSRPLAMMFYNEGDGKDIAAEQDAKDLGKAFRDLGWPECSVQVQHKDFKWSCNQLLDKIRSQLLKPRGATPGCPVLLVVLFMPLFMVLPMFLLGILKTHLMMILQIFSLVVLKCYGWCYGSNVDSWCYSCSWWWSYSLYYWWFMVYSFVCWLLYSFARSLPIKSAAVGSECASDRGTVNTTNTTDVTNAANTTNKTSATNTKNATNCSLFIISISAHGSAGMISGHHGPDGKIDDILELVDELLPSFIPKVIIIDACQDELPWPFPNPGVSTIRPNMLLLMATVRGEYSRGGRYLFYLAKEVEIGNDSLQNMHCRAALKTMSHKKEAKDIPQHEMRSEIPHKKEAKGEKCSESPPDQVAVSQSTTAKKIFLRNFNHTDRCHKKDCKVSDDKTGYVTCSNCPAMYHVVCIAKERYEKRERLVPKNLPALKKCGVQWFCTKCEERFVRL